MKKIVCLLIVSILLSVSLLAASTENEKFDIPKANQAPVIDGKIDGDEWDNALVRTLTADNVTAVSGDGMKFPNATFRWMWDDAGMYVFAEVSDTTKPDVVHAPGIGSYNSGDGIQVCVYTSDDIEGSNVGTLFFYSLVPADTSGNPQIGEHFVYGDGGTGSDVPAGEATIASVVSDGKYTIEAFIAKESWAKSDPSIVIKEGLVLPLANIVMEQDGGSQALFTDTAWFSGINSNKYTLVNTPAGHIEVAEVPATEALTESAPVTTVPEVTQTAPQTNDNIIIFATFAVLAVAAAFAMRRKVTR